jgi:hypothetical protein
MTERGVMGTTALRVAATAVTFALGGIALGAPHAGAREAIAPIVQQVPQWQSMMDNARESAELANQISLERMRSAEALRLSTVDLALKAQAANKAWEASAGKASDAARQALVVERNRATSAVRIGSELEDIQAVEASLAAASATVAEEVKAWEEAEAARKAEEARQAAAAAARGKGGKGGGGGVASGDPKAYLDGIAAAWGATISWGSTACGTGSSTTVGGCYAGGSTVMISNSAYRNWDVAKGRGRNVLLHEIAHMVILNKCGTVYVSDRFENVTDAYAILIGAGAGTGYGYNDADMSLAKSIKDGVCWA